LTDKVIRIEYKQDSFILSYLLRLMFVSHQWTRVVTRSIILSSPG